MIQDASDDIYEIANNASNFSEMEPHLTRLFESGRVHDAKKCAMAFIDANPDAGVDNVNLAGWIVRRMHAKPEALAIYDRYYEQFKAEPQFLGFYGILSIFTFYDEEQLEKGMKAALDAIAISGLNGNAFSSLIRGRILQGRITEAYLAALAHDSLAGQSSMWSLLCDYLIKGIKALTFSHEEIDYKLLITPATPACMHVFDLIIQNKYPEIEELHYTRDVIGPVDSILEVGCLLGTHTVYYQKNLAPRFMTCIEAHPALAEATEYASRENQHASVACTCDVHMMWANDVEAEPVIIAGQSVPKKPIDAITTQTYDFIKIDVDGGEMEVLNGAEAAMTRGEPWLMIEVSNENEDEVLGWLKDRGYEWKHSIKRDIDVNHFLKRHAG